MFPSRDSRVSALSFVTPFPGVHKVRRRTSRQSNPASLDMTADVLRFVDAFGLLAVGAMTARWVVSARFASPLSIALLVCLASLSNMNLLRLAGAYRRKRLDSLLGAVSTGLGAWLLTATAAAALTSAFEGVFLRPLVIWLGLWTGGMALLFLLSRCAYRVLTTRWRQAGRLERTAVVLGAGTLGQGLIKRLSTTPESGIRIVGVYDDRKARLPRLCHGYPIRGNTDDLVRDIRQRPVDCVFVALPMSADWRLAELMNKLTLVPVDVRLCADNFGFRIGECGVSHVAGLTVLNVRNRPLRGWPRVTKAIEDKVLATAILALVAPVMAVAALFVKLDSRGPVLFRQKRLGMNNELIEVLKFRTLYDNARDANAERLCTSDDPRITRVGGFLRKSMIDELPQFINVLRGDMSIVGPRPHALAAKAGGALYPDAVRYYDARHRMKPGITGWAQINGWRGETRTVEEIQQRVEHDLYYIQNWSILFDLKIVALTVLGAFAAVLPFKSSNRKDHAVPVADIGGSRSAA